MEIVFKRAAEDDWGAVSALEKDVSANQCYFPITEEEKVKEYIRKSHVFLIQSKGKTIGTISYELKGEDSADLDGLTVSPDFQKHGIATKAMEFVMGKLKGIKQITLAVHPKNTPAIKLYLNFGFQITGWKENYYGDGEPRLILVTSGHSCAKAIRKN